MQTYARVRRAGSVAVVILAILSGRAGTAAVPPLSTGTADHIVRAVARVELRTRRRLERVERVEAPLARRCLVRTLRQVRTARGRVERARGQLGERRQAMVALSRAYLEAVVLDQDAGQCQELVPLLPPAPPGGIVEVEVDPDIPRDVDLR